MATDERNFRSSYYEKVGCRGVEEKKSLEILMKEQRWDRVKLKQFCLRFTLPTSYRKLLWKVLLDILPVFPDSHQFVWEQRLMQYSDLQHGLRVMALIDDTMPKPRQYLAMWYLETGNWQFGDVPAQYLDSALMPIAKTLQEVFDDDADVYWLTKKLYEFTESFEKDIPKLVDFTKNLLEEKDAALYSHLVETKSFGSLPFEKWFRCCFAGVLDDSSLVKIWDKLVGGSPKILSFVAAMLLMTLRRNILKAKDTQQILKCIAQIPDQTEEVIANKTMELWQSHGSMLPVQSEGHAKK